MARPAVGAALRRCAECGGYEYGGAPDCGACRELVDGIIEDEWAVFVQQWGVVTSQDAVALAEMVAAEPDRHDWRLVDAALDRLVCAECGSRLSRGPVGCSACDLAHGFRYAAIETDRPGVPRGNEHGIRVNVSVVRRPHVTSANELLARRLLLPLVLVGRLPTTEEAQRMSALIKNSPPAQRVHLIEQAIEAALRRQDL
ncbi:hypothetical protein LN042_15050 [Kitasatospora sp. RB6PN24]|uniref:hypothetical protein n=1 Tax=Kitasatospora humi TaxID=2893891 RepID=UPI001E4B1A8B|nr:hypothetical protein [Kitasatospora humi]MCC9308391.1 hypothetical protein [Kitasatospora humi]